jgi:hypothetical protein
MAKNQYYLENTERMWRWWAQRDLNPRPSDYESPALTPELWAHLLKCNVLHGFYITILTIWNVNTERVKARIPQQTAEDAETPNPIG